ncbi:N-acetylmuramoyl-L-alanine amidase [Amycolatopsis xylanica]|uniref:N-acetylmuramoyl-L-alanine amidase n=1 Tax=Amycolatopsis xylanica TaxID=589385 RepID=UPI003CCC0A64
MRRRVVFSLLTGSMLLMACRPDPPPPIQPIPPAASSESAPASESPDPTPPSSAASSSEPSAPAKTGKVIVLDPGHNGGNGSHAAEINKQVPAGRGQTKPCNTTGTSTNAGYPEHAFTFDVAKRVSAALTAKGIKVIMTRQDDSGVGPCVDKRAAAGNSANADAVISIHADGSNSAGAHGFHVAYSSPPLNAQQGEPSTRLARALRDGIRDAGIPTSTYLGQAGLAPRADLAGLNLSTRPAALVECGNMRNADEAAAMASPEGRQRYASAIAAAIEAYLA